MKIVKNIIAAILVILGGFWALQGAKVINSGVMAGHRRWIAIGGVVLIVGIVLFFVGNKKKTDSDSKSTV